MASSAFRAPFASPASEEVCLCIISCPYCSIHEGAKNPRLSLQLCHCRGGIYSAVRGLDAGLTGPLSEAKGAAAAAAPAATAPAPSAAASTGFAATTQAAPAAAGGPTAAAPAAPGTGTAAMAAPQAAPAGLDPAQQFAHMGELAARACEKYFLRVFPLLRLFVQANPRPSMA
ncbi:hypothetical protein Esi_0152_0025 [Ectocarpus siliculosus]|uniref:Uncharacterized protein n=1 Tax=Ectocarpus siliculosus TaxID=2880 RepID=D8LFW1_ECTSI|nr:hypothetical protein Esi_0152_0025 [Ectocarpus siliculosus]|eukprot:CBN78860.1 hypothetical protein Esi_0152_0025 [Ectocarpus siliculosus]